MTVANLIRKGGLAQVATATPATLATQEAASAATVAQVATVAVARPPPTAEMTAEEEMDVRAWFAQIEETDEAIIAQVLNRCRQAPDARAYFMRLVSEVSWPDPLPDDRRRCDQCTNLTERGRCLAGWRGEIVANRDYEPVRDLPRRCEGYAPGGDDPDRRAGWERWPELIRKGDE